jgi:hypothetical protein
MNTKTCLFTTQNFLVLMTFHAYAIHEILKFCTCHSIDLLLVLFDR